VHAAVRPTVAVLGFKNQSGRSDAAWISPAFSQMVGTELTTGEKLRIIPSEQVTHGKIDLALPNEDSLRRDTLARVRSNMGSDFVVLGSFLDIGGQVRLDLSLQDTVSGETLANISESGTEQELPDLAAKAGERLRQKLGVSEPSALDAAHAKASQSSNLEATKLYSEGFEKLHSYDSAGAKELIEQALLKDPNYALAHSALAEVWRSLGYNSKSTAEAKKALELSDNLSRENRLAIEAQYRNSTHELAREAEIYKSLFDFYPDNLEYGLSLAKSLSFNAHFAEANSTLDALQRLPSPQGDDPRIDHIRSSVAIGVGDNKRALSLAEEVTLRAQQRNARRLAAQALMNQCSQLFKLGEPLKADTACDQSKAIFSEIGDYTGEASVWGLNAFQAGINGDPSKGRSSNERQIALLKKVENDSGLGYAMNVAGELSADSGDYQRALKEYSDSLELYKKVGYQQGIVSAYGNLGWVYASQGNLTEALKNDDQAIALRSQTSSHSEMDMYLVNKAEVLLNKGDVVAAAESLDKGFDVNKETGDKRVGIYLHTARSKLFFATSRLDESRREAEIAIKTCLDIRDEDGAEQRRILLARLDTEENRINEAIQASRKSLSYFGARPGDNQVDARSVLIQALLLDVSQDSTRREIDSLKKIAPDTQNADSRLGANVQIGRKADWPRQRLS
jgi:eukaryotic-like serine/threonine-protein kinase